MYCKNIATGEYKFVWIINRKENIKIWKIAKEIQDYTQSESFMAPQKENI